MVTFTRIPYSDAKRRAQLQDRIVYATLMALATLILTCLLWLIR